MNGEIPREVRKNSIEELSKENFQHNAKTKNHSEIGIANKFPHKIQRNADSVHGKIAL
jgi:hypothetical protein